MDLRRNFDRLGRVLTLTIAVALLVAGLVIGLMPLAVDGSACGSALFAGDPYTSPLACSQLRSSLRPFALSGLGAALIFTLATIAFAPSMVDAVKESSPVPDTGDSGRA
jgi:hypothetical protein